MTGGTWMVARRRRAPGGSGMPDSALSSPCLAAAHGGDYALPVSTGMCMLHNHMCKSLSLHVEIAFMLLVGMHRAVSYSTWTTFSTPWFCINYYSRMHAVT